MVLGKIISSEGYTFGQKWIISMIFRSFFITCIHKYGPKSPCASKMISIFMIFYYLYGIFWYCEVRSVGSLTLIKSRFGRGVYHDVKNTSTFLIHDHKQKVLGSHLRKWFLIIIDENDGCVMCSVFKSL